jgi:hypothetical protein
MRGSLTAMLVHDLPANRNVHQIPRREMPPEKRQSPIAFVDDVLSSAV